MIIVDISQILYSNLWVNPELQESGLKPELFRHMALNMVRSINVKFRNDYGTMVIACDNKTYWRREFFPYYKANRKKGRDRSELDWRPIFETMGKIREELKEFFPYRVIDVTGAEADDVIGTLVASNGSVIGGQPLMIVSGDKDFSQLQVYGNVRQYDPVRKHDIVVGDPEDFLLEHVIRGDSGDGVPNILSDDDTFVTDKRQRPITAKRMAELKKNPIGPNFNRNNTLINLSLIPETIRANVLAEYDAQAGKDRSQLFKYMGAHGLNNLMQDISDF